MNDERYFIARKHRKYVKPVKRIFLFCAYLRFPRMPKAYKYFIRENYFSKAYQLKFFIRDYILKRPYKEISYQGEFQQELSFVLPFAYWHYCNGTLKRTIASQYTHDLYSFSPEHDERFDGRNWIGIFDYRIPNVAHIRKFNTNKWKPVPLKDWYHNDIFRYNKPMVIIANRYNQEWEGEPVSYFDIPTLDRLIHKLEPYFQVVYNRPNSNDIVGDNSAVLELSELEWMRQNHPHVVIAQDLYKDYKEEVRNFNHLQLMLYSNCSYFISTHGGTGTLASYFGGINILYSRFGHEHYFKEFDTIFPRLSGANICHVRNYDMLLQAVDNMLLWQTKADNNNIKEQAV